MKNLLHFILMFLLLAAFGVGCSRGGGDAELVAIDSLIAASPDSALAALGRIDTAALGEGGRAYHALLTVQAHYAAYDPATDSTDICRAWRWYAHHGPADRQLRAMRYRATVAEEMGDPVTAMRWYKRTELAAREQGDDLAAGNALMDMGVLYMQNYEDERALERFRQALNRLPDDQSEQIIFCSQNLAQLYQKETVRAHHADSSLHFIRLTRRLATACDDSTALALSWTTEAGKWFYDSCYDKAKDIAVLAIRRFPNWVDNSCWHYAVQAFAALGNLDSAQHYLAMMPPLCDAADTMQYEHSLSLINTLKGKWETALHNEQESDNAGERILFADRPKTLSVAESEAIVQAARERAEAERTQSNMVRDAILAVIILALAAITRFLFFHGRLKAEEIERLESCNRDKDSKLKVAHDEIFKINAKNQENESQINSLKQQVNQTRRHAEHAKARHAKTLEQLKRAIAREKQANKAHKQEVARLRQQARQVIEQWDADKKQLERLMAELARQGATQQMLVDINSAFEDVVDLLCKVTEGMDIYANNPSAFIKAFRGTVTGKWSKKELWLALEMHIQATRPEAMQCLNALSSPPNERHRRLVILTLMGFSDATIAVCLGYHGPEVVKSLRSRIMSKMEKNGCRDILTRCINKPYNQGDEKHN